MIRRDLGRMSPTSEANAPWAGGAARPRPPTASPMQVVQDTTRPAPCTLAVTGSMMQDKMMSMAAMRRAESTTPALQAPPYTDHSPGRRDAREALSDPGVELMGVENVQLFPRLGKRLYACVDRG